MDRLLVIIALLFSFAAVAAPAMAAAAAVDGPAALTQALADTELVEACVETQPVAPRPYFKPCPNKHKGGIAVFCHQSMAVLPPLADVPAAPEPHAAFAQPGHAQVVTWSGEREYRPPRTGLRA